MATRAILLQYLDCDTAELPGEILLQCQVCFVEEGLSGRFMDIIAVPIGIGDTFVDIRRKLTDAILTAASLRNFSIARGEVLLPALDRGL